jgi:hypothetical protein
LGRFGQPPIERHIQNQPPLRVQHLRFPEADGWKDGRFVPGEFIQGPALDVGKIWLAEQPP